MSYFKRVAKYTPTRFWVNNATRAQAKLAIEAGAIGCTQNPAYLSKVINSEDDGPYLQQIMLDLIQTMECEDDIVSELQRRAIAGICDCFRNLYDQSGGHQGLVSIQANPFLENTDEILDNAEKMLKLAPNALIKIPATKDGLAAMEILAREKVPVLATEVMSMDQMIAVCEIYERATKNLAHPAPFIFAHINGIFDEHISDAIKKDHISIDLDISRQASLVLGRKMVGYLHDYGWSGVQYLAGGARTLNHFTDWVGVNGHITINWRKTADTLLDADLPVIDVFNSDSSYRAIDELIEKIPEFKQAFVPHSLSVDDFEGFGPVCRFRNQFEDGWNKARAMVRSFKEAK